MLATVQRMLQKFTPSRRAPALALLDTRQPVSAAARQQFKTFPSASPLFSSDPVIVRSAARQLQRSVTEHPEP
jgi:hypothetical protein